MKDTYEEIVVKKAVLSRLRKAVIRANRRLSSGDLRLDASITDDLGFDSLRLIDLTLAIEKEFGIAEFPMQAWYDAEANREGARFTVASLADACQRCLTGD